ncbi:MAG: hypothetical protein ABSH20_15440 [Tepidisphaeraceae bacterium]|jgi:hypothetical protein
MTHVTWYGSEFDISRMSSFKPPEGTIRGIYWTPDYEYVFVLKTDQETGTSMHRAGIPEIDELARRFSIDDLLNAVA